MKENLKEFHGIYTYQSSHSFLQGITESLLKGAEASSDPFYLSSYTILLPTARAKRALIQTFLNLQKEKGKKALFLPTFFTLGEISKRPIDFLKSLYPPSFHEELALKLIPSNSSVKDPFFVCLSIAQKVSSSFEEQIILAENLCEFLDLLESQGKKPEDISLSLHGKSTLFEEKCLLFWDLFKEIWSYFNENSKTISPSQCKEYIFSALAKIIAIHKTERPLMVLGPQGLFPGSKSFLKSILSLPQGSIVLDSTASFALESYQKKPSSFPEFWLYEERNLIKFLEVPPSSFLSWPVPEKTLQPPSSFSLFLKGLEGSSKNTLSTPPSIHFFEAENLFEQARYIAVKMRGVLLDPTKTAALITPSRALAQAVREELKRWDISVDDSLGTPLSQTKAGTFLLLLSSIWEDPVNPFILLSIFKHPYSFLFSSQDSYQKSLFALETYALRGISPKTYKDLKERILKHITLSEEDRLEIVSFLDLLAESFSPIFSLSSREKISFVSALHQIQNLFLALIPSPYPDDVQEILSFLQELLSESAHSLALFPHQISYLLRKFLDGHSYYNEALDHPRLSIWGCTESRLLKRDMFILGDLNEGYWPKAPYSNPWITPELLEKLGLSLHQKERGEMAHDFAHALLAPEIILTYRKKDADGLLDPSCFLLYLKQAFMAAGKALPLDTEGSELTQKLSPRHKSIASSHCPSPFPPLNVRPKELSVTDIGLLRRDPYEFYAKKILRLIPAEPFFHEPGAQDFGNLLHRYLELYIKRSSQNSITFFLERLEQEPIYLTLSPFKKKVWKARLQTALLFFEEQYKTHLEDAESILCEYPLTYSFNLTPSLTFSLQGRVDSLEIKHNLSIVSDYKTGALPSLTSIQEGFSPQLPLLGFLVKNSIKSIPKNAINLRFWHFGKRPALMDLSNSESLIEDAQEGLYRLLFFYYSEEKVGFTATIHPHSLYTHLKRTKEWAGPASVFTFFIPEEEI